MFSKLKKQKSLLEAQGYNVAYICVYGSQNYGMAIDTPEYKSDVDMKAVIIPTLDDLIWQTKPVSTSITTEWGLCDLKDIREYAANINKANPVYIESLYTEYFILGNSAFAQLRTLRKDIVFGLSHLFVRGALGQMQMKREALCHPYPSTADKIEKYGYDPKQLHHIGRLDNLIRNFNPSQNIEPRFIPDDIAREDLINLKISTMPLDEAIKLADYIMGVAKCIVDTWMEFNGIEPNYTIKDKVTEIARTIVKQSIVG